MHGYGRKKTPGYDERTYNLSCCGAHYWEKRDKVLKRARKSGHRRRVNAKLEDMRQRYNAISEEYGDWKRWYPSCGPTDTKFERLEKEAY